MVRLMKIRDHQQVICAKGYSTIRAAREHFNLEKCVGVDISEHMLRMAEDLIESE